MFSRKIYLKGTNKLRPPNWKGLNISLSYIGSLDTHFGIYNRKLTMNDAMKHTQMKSFIRKFHNTQLKSISHVNPCHSTFEEINLRSNKSCNVNQLTSPYEHSIVDKLNDAYLMKLRKKRNASSVCLLKKSVRVQTEGSSLESRAEKERVVKRIVEGYSYKNEKFPMIEEKRSRNWKDVDKWKSMVNVNRGFSLFLQRNKWDGWYV